MSGLPIWAQWVQLAVTFAIAVFAAGIAFRQWQTAHQRVMLDLFERRMAVYESARAVIGEIVREGTANTTTYIHFIQATDRLPFLFGNEVISYSNATRDLINRLSLHSSMIRAQSDGHPVANYNHHVDKQAEVLFKITKFYDEFGALITPYVRMTQKHGPLLFERFCKKFGPKPGKE